MDFISIARDVLKTETDELISAASRIDASWNRVVEMVYATRGKIIIMGVGKSGLVGGKIAATLASTGTPSFFIHPTEAMHGDLGMIGKEDLVIAISNSGESEELVAIVPHIKRFSIPLIGMSAKRSSSLARQSDAYIDITIKNEACPLGIAPMSSTTLTMAMGDALAVCLMKKRGFQKEDFASFHPGGALGKRLFVKATDLARTSDLPVISDASFLKEAIEVMTRGKIGTVVLTDGGNHVTALLSDGDLRRALLDDAFSLDNRALQYATKNPKTVNAENLLAAEALEIIEADKIQVLLLLNHDGTLYGILHIHDLVEAGIA